MYRSVDHRLIKIIDEILVFLYSLDPSKVDMQLNRKEEFSELLFDAQVGKKMETKRIERIDRLLSCPRRRELEENYWELTGNDTTPSSELALVGMMTDDHDFIFNEEEMTVHIRLRRNK